MAPYKVIYRDPDGYRMERVVQADKVVQAAGVNTFGVTRPSRRTHGVPAPGMVVWQLRTDRVETYPGRLTVGCVRSLEVRRRAAPRRSARHRCVFAGWPLEAGVAGADPYSVTETGGVVVGCSLGF